MTRLAQAMEWWKNQKGTKIFAHQIPERHREILVKHKKITFNYGITSRVDYYTLVE